jgi:hypothetical protein
MLMPMAVLLRISQAYGLRCGDACFLRFQQGVSILGQQYRALQLQQESINEWLFKVSETELGPS